MTGPLYCHWCGRRYEHTPAPGFCSARCQATRTEERQFFAEPDRPSVEAHAYWRNEEARDRFEVAP